MRDTEEGVLFSIVESMGQQKQLTVIDKPSEMRDGVYYWLRLETLLGDEKSSLNTHSITWAHSPVRRPSSRTQGKVCLLLKFQR